MYANETICKILIYIDNNLLNKIDIDYLSKHFYINRYYLMKLFKKEIGITINSYINCIKVKNSMADLQSEQIIYVALKNGFNSQEYYSEMFKKIIGVAPIKYKMFYNHNKNISKSNIDIIRNNIIKLNTIVEKKNNYLLNRKPNTSVIKFHSFYN